MSSRRKARKRALDILFESEMRGVSPVGLAQASLEAELSEQAYVERLVSGVVEHSERIDELINTYAEGWEMDRMPAVDRNLLRIALYEILWETELDDSIAISEAVDLAQDLSTKDSAAYINGILARIVTLKSVL